MTDAPNDADEREPDSLQQRVELLELENARLRKRLEAVVGPDNPAFDVMEFQKALMWALWPAFIPALLGGALLFVINTGVALPDYDVLPGLPLFAVFNGPGNGPFGVALGLFAAGGMAVGGLAIGGGAIGVIAVGGGALGLAAFGGGAVGLIALGGGAFGVIAIGGGAAGWYVLAGDGWGKYVLSRRRQDPEAVAFFTRYVPRLKRAFKDPMPVIQVDDGAFR